MPQYSGTTVTDKPEMPATLLVLGAGASKDLSFPLGEEMLRLILYKTCTQRKGDNSGYISDLVNKLKKAELLSELPSLREWIWEKFEANEWHALRDQKSGLPQSIDHYLIEATEKQERQKRQAWYEIIQFAISYLMLGYEAAAIGLPQSKGFDSSSLWSTHLLATLIDNYGWDQVAAKLRVITFNYERTFEHAVCKTLKSKGVPKKDDEIFAGAHFMENNIHHVYGMTGKYCPQNISHESYVPFGFDNKTAKEIEEVSKSISLIRSGGGSSLTDPSAPFSDWFKEAQEIYFLGFGFAEDNLEKLEWNPDTYFSGKTVLSTGKFEPVPSLLRDIVFTGYYCEEFISTYFTRRADQQKP